MEQRERRITVACILQAEEDRRFLREQLKLWVRCLFFFLYFLFLLLTFGVCDLFFKDREADAMKDVDGWVVGQSTYETRWMPSARHL